MDRQIINRWVVAASSFDPIDLFSTCVAIHTSAQISANETLVIFEDHLFKKQKCTRSYIHRFSFPTYRLIEDEEGQLRQRYIPVDADGDWKKNITKSSSTIINILKKNGFFEEAKQTEHKIKLLIEYLELVAPDPIEIIKESLRTVLQSLCGGNVNVVTHSELFASNDGKIYIRRTLSKLYNELKLNYSVNKFSFLKGGSIDINLNGRWSRCKTGQIEGDHIFLYDSTDFEEKVFILDKTGTIKTYPLMSEIGQGKIFLRGPLIVMLLIELGRLAFLPWYCEIWSHHKYVFRCEEFISPISVASNLRASKWCGGGGIRHQWAGYSLVEYIKDSKVIELVVRELANAEGSIEDWLHLIQNLPVTKEKAARSQKSIAGYIQRKLNEFRLLTTEEQFNLFESESNIKTTHIGIRLLILATLLKTMHKLWYQGNLKENQKILNNFSKRNWVNSDSFDFSKLLYHAKESILSSFIWRSSLVDFSSSIKNNWNIENDLMIYNQSLPDCLLFPFRSSKYNNIDSAIFSSLYNLIITEAHSYYKTVLALVSSILKCTIWNWWLIADEDIFSDIICTRFTKSNRIPICLNPRLWKDV